MPKHGPSLGGGRVDALLEHLQADSPLTQLGAEGDQMQHGPTEPVQPRDRQDVAFAPHFEQHIELRAGGLRPAGGVQMDVVPLDAGPGEGVELVGRIPICGRDPGVAEQIRRQ